MLIWTVIKVAVKSLLANKLRTLLAMLGIIIGVGAVISMLALGAGAQAQVMDRVTAMGTNLLIVRSGGRRRGGVRSEGGQSLVLGDAEAILELPDIESLSPVASGRAQVKYYNQNVNTTITGAALTYFGIRSFEVVKGRPFTSVEEEGSARVAVLGAATAEQLFGATDPLGERVRIKSVNFRVVGVLAAKGDQGWFNPDDMVVIPYSTAMKQILGQQHLNEVDVKAAEGADLSALEGAITELMRKRHKIRPGAEDDFNVRNQAEMIEMATTVAQTFTILLGGIASISLVVGGIGIMNIMLVTVTERTREIGVRKAIGARNRDILGQFLLESILISGAGGVLGIAAGFGVAHLVSRVSEFQTVVEPTSVLLSLGVSAAVGVFFGFYPARRAARLHPIEALRYE